MLRGATEAYASGCKVGQTGFVIDGHGYPNDAMTCELQAWPAETRDLPVRSVPLSEIAEVDEDWWYS